MFHYLTQLLAQPVCDPDGRKVARVLDVIAHQGERFPTVAAIFVRGKDREGWFSVDQVTFHDDRIDLSESIKTLKAYEPKHDDIRLQRDILDKQIVDVHDYRVIRVNDVRLAECGDRWCVVGADASLRAIVRRAGLGKPVEAVAKMIGKPLSSNIIAWSDVETLEPSGAGGGRIKLKVPHGKIARLHPADIADIIEQLDPQRRTEVIEALDIQTAADTLEEMEEEQAAAVIETLQDEHAADLLEEMEPDAAADILADVSDAHQEDIFEHMEPEDAADVKELMAFGEETAGGLMNNDFIAIQAALTCDETIQRLRELAPGAEQIYYVYVIDDDERLVGVISLRDLIVSQPSTTIAEIMKSNVRAIHTSTHTDEVARILNKYNLLALPVIDDDQCLAGIVMVDDVMERLMGPEKRKKLPQLHMNDN